MKKLVLATFAVLLCLGTSLCFGNEELKKTENVAKLFALELNAYKYWSDRMNSGANQEEGMPVKGVAHRVRLVLASKALLDALKEYDELAKTLIDHKRKSRILLSDTKKINESSQQNKPIITKNIAKFYAVVAGTFAISSLISDPNNFSGAGLVATIAVLPISLIKLHEKLNANFLKKAEAGYQKTLNSITAIEDEASFFAQAYLKEINAVLHEWNQPLLADVSELKDWLKQLNDELAAPIAIGCDDVLK